VSACGCSIYVFCHMTTHPYLVLRVYAIECTKLVILFNVFDLV
jgi:hypothetical protein